MPVTDEHSFFPAWKRLHEDALRKRVPYHDAEDIVSETLLKATETFDQQRGDFDGFCYSILRNKIKNYWRDKKPQTTLEDGQYPNDDPSPISIMIENEAEERAKAVIAAISPLLTNDERTFLEMLGQVLAELEGRAVTETSRRLGIEPLKGHDIFRRIQRKALKMQPPPPSRDMSQDKDTGVRYSIRMPGIDELDPDEISLATVWATQTSFHRFVQSLALAQREKLTQVTAR